jgi:hypothetical protein
MGLIIMATKSYAAVAALHHILRFKAIQLTDETTRVTYIHLFKLTSEP